MTTQITSPVTVDSSVGTDGRVDIDAIDATSFWLAYFDDADNDIFYGKYFYNGTAIISPWTIWVNEGDADNVGIATLNSTHAVVTWNDDVTNYITFVVTFSPFTQVNIEAIADSQQVSASAFNSTHFVIGFYAQGDDDMSYETYAFPSTSVSGLKDHDTAVGTASAAPPC